MPSSPLQPAHLRRVLPLAVLVGTGLASTAARAEAADGAAAAPATADNTLAEVIVTATKVESNVQKIPVTVQVMSAEDVVKSGVQGMQDLGKIAPGLYVNNAGPGSSSFYIRGIGTRNDSPSADNGVAVSLDQMYFSRSTGIDGALFDVDRVEVLKGPQGTLYGRNANSGAINFVSRKPGSEFGGNFGVEIGNFDAIKTWAGVDLPLSGTMFSRAAFQTIRHSGYTKDGYNDRDTQSARVHFLWKPSERGSLLLSVDYNHEGGRGPSLEPYVNGTFASSSLNTVTNTFVPGGDPFGGGGSPAAVAYTLLVAPATPAGPGVLAATNFGFGNGPAYAPPGVICPASCVPYAFGHQGQGSWYVLDNGFIGVRDYSYRADAELDLGFAQWSTIGAHFHLDDKALFYNGPTPVYQDWRVNQDSLETRLASATDRKVSWIVGAFYLSEDQSDLTLPGATGGTATVHPIANVAINPTKNDTTYAFFGEAKWNVTDAVHAVLGARYTNDAKKETSQSYVIGSDPSYAAGSVINGSAKASYSASTYHVGVDYDITPQNMAYVSYSTGFHAGGLVTGAPVTRRICAPVNPTAPVAADFVGCDVAADYKPETLKAYSIGSKNRFFGNTLQLNAEIYYWDYKDLQVTHLGLTNPGVASLRPDNAGNATVKGLELDLAWHPTVNDTLTMNYGHNEGKYGDYIYYQVFFPGATPSVFNFSNRDFLNNAKDTISAAFKHVFALGNGGKLTPSVDAIWRSRVIYGYAFNSNGTPAVRGATIDVAQPGHTRYNLYLTYAAPSDNFEVGAFVRNAGNDTAITGASGNNTPGTNSTWANPGTPRTFGIQVTGKF